MPDIHALRQPTAEFWLGVRHELPLQLGVIPFGLVFGILGLASGLTGLQTILLSSILFGGASQVVFAQLWAAGVPPLVIGGSVSVVNLGMFSTAHQWDNICGICRWDGAFFLAIC